MTYLRELFDRYRQGDVVASALSKAVAAVDPGLQLTFVFTPEDAKAVQEGKLADTAEPQGIKLTRTPNSTGFAHPGVVAARLRAIAAELDAVLLRAADMEAEAAAKPVASTEQKTVEVAAPCNGEVPKAE